MYDFQDLIVIARFTTVLIVIIAIFTKGLVT